jgi:tetratricopeptide (TPR) repeat protein
MNIKKIYLILGALVISAVILVLLLAPGDSGKQDQAATMPPGHPNVEGMEQIGASSMPGQPGKDNVKREFLDELETLKKKVDAAPKSDTTDVQKLAWYLYQSHRAAEALPYYERYVKAAPKNTDALLDLVLVHYELKNFDQSLALTNHILKIDPRNTKAMYNAGIICAAMGRKEEAIKRLEDLILRYRDSDDAARAREVVSRMK